MLKVVENVFSCVRRYVDIEYDFAVFPTVFRLGARHNFAPKWLGSLAFLSNRRICHLTASLCLSGERRPPDYTHATRFLDHLGKTRLSSARALYKSAARHFLFWLEQRSIAVCDVDESIVQRFRRHRCRCPRYSAQQVPTDACLSRVRRFVRFLEDAGDIPVAGGAQRIDVHLADYAKDLSAEGYSVVTWRRYYAEAEHFSYWLRFTRQLGRDVDEDVIERFVQHRCRCPITRKRGKLAEPTGQKHRRRGASRFVAFLRARSVILPAAVAPNEDQRVAAFRLWLKRHRGATDATIWRYVHEVLRWLSKLPTGPAAYDVTTVRDIVLKQPQSRSRSSVRLTVTVLRAYLRFLSARGECRPELAYAVPSTHRRKTEIPRHIAQATIESIIASCDTTTPVGIRDKAIILLLVRLGLRAGDVWALRLADLDWASGRIAVKGKSRRPSALPLPQDAGEALLAYLNQARPRVSHERVFLRVQAPFRPFSSSSEIAGIVSRVLARSGIDGVPTGAHVFRHSLATNMLRSGASLDAVGTLLRHSYRSSTAIYAKVDAPMLQRVAQPWPGSASC
jgi:site-specific recombinase XerD